MKASTSQLSGAEALVRMLELHGVEHVFGLCGEKAWSVAEPSELRSVLDAAVNHAGPTLVDVISQPLHEARAPMSEWAA